MISPLTIRLATSTDADVLSKLILNNAKLFLKPYYSTQQWDVFENYYSVETVEQKILTQKVFCAILNGNIVGTIALDKNYVVGFYTHIDAVKKGVGSTLLHFIENEAKAIGISELFLASSPVGVLFYQKHEWQIVEEIAIEYIGVPFIETIMKKQL